MLLALNLPTRDFPEKAHSVVIGVMERSATPAYKDAHSTTG